MNNPVMTSTRPVLKINRWLSIVAIGLASLSALACMSNPKIIELDDRFSVNVVRTPHWFPDPKAELTPAEQEILSKRGKPDYIRFWWNPDGELINSSDLSGKDQKTLLEDMAYGNRSWIFYRDQKEIVFRNESQDYTVEDLDEVLALVCRYGDPNMIQGSHIIKGELHETWTWIEHGWQYDLIDNKIVNKRRVPKTGAGTSLMK